MIPKKIHYCWFGTKPFPKVVQECIKTWKENLPDYEFCFWNEANTPMDVLFVKKAYDAKKYAFVADYVRFWVLYNYGGIYLDTDMYVLRSLNDLLHNECFWGFETPENKIISCGIVGSKKGNKFIFKLLDSYNQLKFDLNNMENMIVTRHISRCYNNFSEKNEIKIYPYTFFYPFPYKEKENVRNFIRYKTPDTYAIHLWNISWGSKWAKMRDWLFYYLRKYLKK